MTTLIERLGRRGALDRLLARPSPALDYSKSTAQSDHQVTIRFLGTASFVIEGAGRTLVFDPYVSRPSIKEHFEPLIPDQDLIRSSFPKADQVYVGHAHSDHILDAPDLCKQTGARLIGSDSVCVTGRAVGLSADSLQKIRHDRECLVSEDQRVRVTALASRHGFVTKNKVAMKLINGLLQRISTGNPERDPIPMFEDINDDFGVMFPRETPSDLPWPAYFWEFGCGQVYDWLVEIEGLRILHIDSARLEEGELNDLEADVVCLCAMGRKHSKDFTRYVIETLRPRVIIPCHWDNFFAKPDQEDRLIPLRSSKINQWLVELREYLSDYDFLEEIHLLRYNQTIGF
ncbi:MAG: MBL fold metallo-hydrolase [Verrucomicrobiota bacterium]